MRKNDFLTPKAIANRIKAKGLQKLRWYCQMCQKQCLVLQCHDENCFKCHCMSEGHQRQMQIFGQNPTRIVEGYTEEFKTTFLEHMKRNHRLNRVAATVVYNEYINDRNHAHMNSTEWATLTEFVKYLGRTRKCKVEETPKGWFITYIDKDSYTLFKKKMKNKRIKADLVDEKKQEKEIQKQIERAEQLMLLSNPESNQPSQVETIRELNAEDGIKIGFSLGSSAKPIAKDKGKTSRMAFDEVDEEKYEEKNRVKNLKRKESGGGKSTLDEMIREEERKKEKINRKDYWLHEGIVVKVMSKVLAEKGYYKQKGVMRKVIDKYIGEIKMLESKHMLRVDQEELETVIPQVGGRVKIVNGAYRGSLARLLGVDTYQFCAKVQIEKGAYDNRVLKVVEYEDICKVA
ncbi:KIN17-like protein [Vicia villosa]|uniref:KIN17-like protein n=1 Tax=Vicia villosa TaxID=3911 RepID=UPI00273B0AE6|nr:KIN17-like protein [Vicia villosa]